MSDKTDAYIKDLETVLEAYRAAHERLAGKCHPFCAPNCSHKLWSVKEIEDRLNK